jgi:hypothetical protein
MARMPPSPTSRGNKLGERRQDLAQGPFDAFTELRERESDHAMNLSAPGETRFGGTQRLGELSRGTRP